MNVLRVLVLVLALPCAALAAQVSDEALVSGLIVNSVSERPVVRAGIVVRQVGKDPMSASAPVSTDGRFSLNLPAGSYRLQATAPGFQPTTFPAITLARGDRRTDVRIRLTPLTSISGAIVGSDGAPVAGALVELIDPARTTMGQRGARRLKFANADERGEYRIRAVPAGRYLVRASADVRGDRVAYLSAFHPGVPSLRDAQPVAIVPGPADARIDFQLPLVKPVRLRLHVEGEGQEWSQFSALSTDAPLSRPLPLLLNRVDSGEYATAMPPGTWRIVVRYTVNGREYRDAQTVAVQGDEQELTFRPLPGIDLDGVLVVEGGAPAAQQAITLSLDPVDDVPYDGPRLSSLAGADGRYTFRAIPAGDWKLVASLPDGTYLKSVQLGGRDLPDAALAVDSQTRGPVRVVVSTRGARVRGQVSGGLGGTVMMIPRGNPIAQCRTASIDPEGRFRLAGLAPGEYRAYVLDSPRPDACTDPESFIPSDAQPVTVKVDEGADIELTLPGLP